MIVRAAIALLVALAVLTPQVEARPSAASHRLSVAIRIARQTWTNACEPSWWTRYPEDDEGINGEAWRSWDANGITTQCEIWLKSDWPTWPWWVLCFTVVHEYGHLAYQGHVDDMSSPMYPTARRLAVCRR